MKKITFLLLSVFVASIGFAQVQMEQQMLQKKVFEKSPTDRVFSKKYNQSKVGNLFETDFESLVWTFENLSPAGANQSQDNWMVGDRDELWTDGRLQLIFNYANAQEYWQFDLDADGDGLRGRMAVMPATRNLWAQQNSQPQKNINAAIRFDNIDLSSISGPAAVSFYGIGNMFNGGKFYLEVSTNGFSSIAYSKLLGGENNSEFGRNDSWIAKTVIVPLPQSLSGQSNVSIRFRFQADARTDGYSNGIFAGIDDVAVYEAVGTNVRLMNQYISFFEYDDYHTVTDARIGQSGYYGNLPSYYAGMPLAFHGCVTSLAVEPVKTELIVKLFKGEYVAGSGWYLGDEVASTRAISANTINISQNDTVDVWDDNEILLPNNLESGRYYFQFYAKPVGATDTDTTDNVATFMVYITGQELGRDAYSMTENSPTARFSKTSQGWTDGYFNYLRYEYILPENIGEANLTSVSIFINGESEINSSVALSFQQSSPDGSAYVDISGASALIEVDGVDCVPGTWHTVNFPAIELPEYFSLRVELSGTGTDGDGTNIWLGEDVRNNRGAEFYTTIAQIGSGVTESYVNGLTALIHLNIDATIVSSPIVEEASNISVFPNPANTQITVANAENQTIEVINVTGQVVAKINNATQMQTIDLSALANGSYFVKINNNVTHISIVK